MKLRTTANKRTGAFTLAEVLAAMLFLAIGLTLMLTRVEEPRKRRAAG